jgi:hypothetical protein
VAFYDGSVALEIEILGLDGGGKEVELSSPTLVAPYGEYSELREINPGQVSSFSDLRMSFLVGKPDFQNTEKDQDSGSGNAP